jgi:hypothetical protein
MRYNLVVYIFESRSRLQVVALAAFLENSITNSTQDCLCTTNPLGFKPSTMSQTCGDPMAIVNPLDITFEYITLRSSFGGIIFPGLVRINQWYIRLHITASANLQKTFCLFWAFPVADKSTTSGNRGRNDKHLQLITS